MSSDARESIALAGVKGVEWLVEAFGCSEKSLTDPDRLGRLFEQIVSELKLTPIGAPQWHTFPVTGGVTGFWLLKESHLAIHTFPEFRSACINLFCCTWHGEPDWNRDIGPHLGSSRLRIRELSRDYAPGREVARESEKEVRV